ncbi:hypothetical protein KQX54_006482 [Cotesia glomerata]|uniref:Uncharacterized protein n=1 Tax=Cotesia glomerata TaxID=32391 RepID=A0AAV7J385_COTGL|nr:hypothetical protein KQX54_006482 [Cotesia glomerata]
MTPAAVVLISRVCKTLDRYLGIIRAKGGKPRRSTQLERASTMIKGQTKGVVDADESKTSCEVDSIPFEIATISQEPVTNVPTIIKTGLV